MPPSKSLADCASAILASPAPVLVVDTCGVLDVTRSLYRVQAASRMLRVGQRAIRKAKAPVPGLHLVLFEEIDDELGRNVPGERTALRIQMDKLEEAGGAIFWPLRQAVWRRSVRKLELALSAFPERWKNAAHVVPDDASCRVRAQRRLRGGIQPAKRGSSNVGDCVITENLLELAAQLRAGGFSREIFFVSSNKRDYGELTPKAPLDAQFGALSIDFYGYIDGAMSQLGF